MIGKSVAKKPYMNLMLNNNVTDTGTGANTPSNTGVTFTTDQFGRANMAGNWDAASDRLAWASSIGNDIAAKINNGGTVVYWIKQRTLSNNTATATFNNTGGAGQSGFYIQNINYSGFNINGVQLLSSVDGTTLTTLNVANLLSYGNWQFCSVQYTDNTTDLTAKITMDSNTGSGTLSKVWTSNTVELRLGARPTTNGSGDFGDMNNFRFYDVTLSDGQIKIINNEKGRIRA